MTEVFIDKNGKLVSYEILSCSVLGYDFENSSIAVLEAAKWKPGMKKGVPTGMRLQVPIHFELVETKYPVLSEFPELQRKISQISKFLELILGKLK